MIRNQIKPTFPSQLQCKREEEETKQQVMLAHDITQFKVESTHFDQAATSGICTCK
jgi:hypothetical protein